MPLLNIAIVSGPPPDIHEMCIIADASYVPSKLSTESRLNINGPALSNSSLWSTIVASERAVDLILAMLERSGNALLSITLQKAPSRNEDFDMEDPSWRTRIYDVILQTAANYKRFFDALLSNMRRVRMLHITVCRTSDIQCLKALITCSAAPELVHFSLDVTSCSIVTATHVVKGCQFVEYLEP
ncbi:hypothetical protein EXIGLDRAFT_696247 [Exidia glandulosa HHB12029]|uniref:Uncharacterized protein n=1 Tax=Exidia glandulosa HHB12029 TaxID=1314781 RepID=A0A165FFY2_EXIGL|nr:hypothetical protein EXIGLDRAFT_696247 [Exidia glandulosa HHB12029]